MTCILAVFYEWANRMKQALSKKIGKISRISGRLWLLPLAASIVLFLIMASSLFLIKQIFPDCNNYDTGLLKAHKMLEKQMEINQQYFYLLGHQKLVNGLSEAEFQNLTKSYLSNDHGLTNIIWSPLTKREWTSDSAYSRQEISKILRAIQQTIRYSRPEENNRQHLYTGIFELVNQERVFALIQPVFEKDNLRGNLIGLYSCKRLEEQLNKADILPDTQIKLVNSDPEEYNNLKLLPSPHIQIEAIKIVTSTRKIIFLATIIIIAGLTIVLILLILFFGKILGLNKRYNTEVFYDLELEHAVISSVEEAVIAVDRFERISMINPPAETLTGFSAEDAVGNLFSDIFVISSLKTNKSLFSPGQKVLKSGILNKLAKEPVLLNSRNGITREIKFRLDEVKDISDGSCAGHVVVFHALQEKVKGSISSLITDDRLIKILEEANLGLWELIESGDKKYSITISRPPFDIIPSQPGAEKVTITFDEWIKLVHPDEAQSLKKRVLRFLGGTETEHKDECRIKDIDGTWRNARFFGNVTERDPKGKVIAINGYIHDITESKRHHEVVEEAKAKAEAASASKSTFLANMSHEIRTPLNAIIGFSGFLADQNLPDESKQYAKIIKSSGKLLLDRLNDILDFSKLEAGKVKILPASCNIRELLEDVYLVMKFDSDKKGISLEIDVPDVFPTMLLDSVRLRQIIINLVNNAIKFTTEGFVRISATTSMVNNNYCSLDIIVEDSGIGIKENARRRIFEAFEQQEFDDDRSYGGTGLGLAIASRLVSLMGGAITLESTIGQGSTFTVKLPHIEIVEDVSGKSKDNDKAHLPEENELSAQTPVNPALAREVVDLFEERLNSLFHNFKTREVNQLAEELAVFAEKNKSEALSKLPDMLRQSAIYFDLIAFERTLTYFKQITARANKD